MAFDTPYVVNYSHRYFNRYTVDFTMGCYTGVNRGSLNKGDIWPAKNVRMILGLYYPQYWTAVPWVRGVWDSLWTAQYANAM